MPESDERPLAVFITPHGFGHAARAAAVMAALAARRPGVHFRVFTTVPEWFLRPTVPCFTYHPVPVDLGLVQRDALVEDPAATLSELDRRLPFPDGLVRELAAAVAGCRAVICDVAALGIVVAQAAGLPSVLVENFTWDWIYEPYAAAHPGFGRHLEYLRRLYARADFHVQTEPVCAPGRADLTTAPVSRAPRRAAAATRQALGIPDGAKLVLVSMGGVHGVVPGLDRLRELPGVIVFAPGSSARHERQGHLIRAPQNSGFYHPDVVAASDAVIAKAGYGTVGEVYHAGVPFGYLLREHFRESGPFGAYLSGALSGRQIPLAEWASGAWTAHLPALLALGRVRRAGPNGADQVADFLLSRL